MSVDFDCEVQECQSPPSWPNFFFCFLVFASLASIFGSLVIVLTASQEPQACKLSFD